MPNIIPIRELRNTAKISEMCNSSREPIFVTKNGYGDMVLMSIPVYEKEFAKSDLHKSVMKCKEQADRGELINGDTVLEELKSKYSDRI